MVLFVSHQPLVFNFFLKLHRYKYIRLAMLFNCVLFMKLGSLLQHVCAAAGNQVPFTSVLMTFSR